MIREALVQEPQLDTETLELLTADQNPMIASIASDRLHELTRDDAPASGHLTEGDLSGEDPAEALESLVAARVPADFDELAYEMSKARMAAARKPRKSKRQATDIRGAFE